MKKFLKQWKLGRPELNTSCFDISRDGELVLHEGNYQYNLFNLARKFGTPLEAAFPFIVVIPFRRVCKILSVICLSLNLAIKAL